MNHVATDLPDVMKHDFLSKTQAASFDRIKNAVTEKKIVVILDYAENYNCEVQNAVQSQHWSKTQATLHPYVIYFKEGNVIKHENYVGISENLQHNSLAVHLFNCKMIAHLKTKFGINCIEEIVYFPDGAGAQYKNVYNLINLSYHKEEFGIKAEWHFFATSHGKGACDGIGGTVKRHAYRSSLQHVNITSPKLMYEWAKTFFKNIKFDFCSNEEHNMHEEVLKARYTMAKTIKNTRQYHCYIPIDKNVILCKLFSDANESVKNTLLKTRINEKKKII